MYPPEIAIPDIFQGWTLRQPQGDLVWSGLVRRRRGAEEQGHHRAKTFSPRRSRLSQ